MSIKVIIEVEKNSSQRAVFDEDLKLIRYRDLSTPYPFAYGFILNTSSDDGDGVDCYILTNKQLEVGALLDCVPIGLLEQFENDEMDNKIICLLENDDFKFHKEHIRQIKDFILQIFKKYPEIKIRFGDYKDGEYAVKYIYDRGQEL